MSMQGRIQRQGLSDGWVQPSQPSPMARETQHPLHPTTPLPEYNLPVRLVRTTPLPALPLARETPHTPIPHAPPLWSTTFLTGTHVDADRGMEAKTSDGWVRPRQNHCQYIRSCSRVPLLYITGVDIPDVLVRILSQTGFKVKQNENSKHKNYTDI